MAEELQEPLAARWVAPRLDELVPGERRRVRTVGVPWWMENVGVLGLAALGLAVLGLGLSNRSGIGVAEIVIGAGMAVVAPLQLRVGLAVGRADIVVHDWWRSQAIPWQDIQRFDLSVSGGGVTSWVLAVHRKDGSRVLVRRVRLNWVGFVVPFERLRFVQADPRPRDLQRSTADLVTDLEHLRRALSP